MENFPKNNEKRNWNLAIFDAAIVKLSIMIPLSIHESCIDICINMYKKPSVKRGTIAKP